MTGKLSADNGTDDTKGPQPQPAASGAPESAHPNAARTMHRISSTGASQTLHCDRQQQRRGINGQDQPTADRGPSPRQRDFTPLHRTPPAALQVHHRHLEPLRTFSRSVQKSPRDPIGNRSGTPLPYSWTGNFPSRQSATRRRLCHGPRDRRCQLTTSRHSDKILAGCTSQPAALYFARCTTAKMTRAASPASSR